MLTTLLLLSLAQARASACSLAQHHTAVRWARRPRRSDRRLYVAAADHACTVLPVPDLPSSTLQSVRARVVRPDARPMVFGSDRLVPTATGWSLHLPEAGEGDVVDLTVQRRLEGDTTPWAPSGAVSASLVVRGRAKLWSAGASADRWWSGRASEPARARALTEAPQGVVLVSTAGSPPEQGPLRPSTRPQSPSGTTVALLPSTTTFLPGEPPNGRTLTATFWDTATLPAWHPGPGSVSHACAVGPDAAEQLSLALATDVTPPSGTSVGAACAWIEDRVRVAGERMLNGDAWRIQGPDLLVWSEPPVAGDAAPGDGPLLPVAGSETGLYEGGPGTRRFVWVLPSLRGQAVLPDRATALERVAYAALHASLPEPGLPLAYKNRSPDAAFVDGLIKRMQRQLRVDALPGRGPLRPRRLVRLKRAGWGTPWEQALLLSRLLRQARVPAIPIPVRPLQQGRVPSAVPVGFTDAVVFVEDEEAPAVSGWGRGVFLAPTCPVCAPGELPPWLWAGQVLTPGQETLPPAPVGEVALHHEGGTTEVVLSAPAALSLRLALLDVPPQARAGALPGLLRLPETTLSSHEGLGSPGQPVTVVLDGILGGALAWRAGGPAGFADAAGTGARVTTRRRVQALPGRMAVVKEGTLKWVGRLEQDASQVVLVEQLEVGAGPLGSEVAMQFAERVAASIETLLAPPALDPDPSTPSAPQDTLSPEVP